MSKAFKAVPQHLVVYGGQYGSEGKASAAEFWIRQARGTKVAFGENSPNSGHTSSKGKTRNIPACSFWADYIVLGPDAVVDLAALLQDWHAIGGRPIFIHENAGLLTAQHRAAEQDVVTRISSTGSGSGAARMDKYFRRDTRCTVRDIALLPEGITVVSQWEYDNLVAQARGNFCVFECSQGVLLDVNLGIYPYVTSRSTLPQCAVARNGLSCMDWTHAGVYRTHPIRTGGPSGPTGGSELSWQSLGRPPEIATVTKRVRRVFEFSEDDFLRSFKIAPPDIVMITFEDYLECSFEEWLELHDLGELHRYPVYVSSRTGVFREWTGRATSGAWGPEVERHNDERRLANILEAFTALDLQ